MKPIDRKINPYGNQTGTFLYENGDYSAELDKPLSTGKRYFVCQDVKIAFRHNVRKMAKDAKVSNSLLFLTITYADNPDREMAMTRLAQFRAYELRKIGGRRWVAVHAFQNKSKKIHHHFVIDTGMDLMLPTNWEKVQVILQGKAMRQRFGRIDFKVVTGWFGLVRYLRRHWYKFYIPVDWGKFKPYTCGGEKVVNADGEKQPWYYTVRPDRCAVPRSR